MRGSPCKMGSPKLKSNDVNKAKLPWLRTRGVFHTKHEAQAGLRPSTGTKWSEALRRLGLLKAEDQLQRTRRGGEFRSATIEARKAGSPRAKTGESRASITTRKIEAAWKHAQAALAVFRPDGQLNDRAWAEAQVADALPALDRSGLGAGRQPLANPGELHLSDRH